MRLIGFSVYRSYMQVRELITLLPPEVQSKILLWRPRHPVACIIKGLFEDITGGFSPWPEGLSVWMDGYNNGGTWNFYTILFAEFGSLLDLSYKNWKRWNILENSPEQLEDGS